MAIMSAAQRRNRQRARKRPPAKRAPARSTCVAVVLIDGDRIRRRAAGALKRARTAFQKAESEWTYYIEKEVPAFARWLHVECGPLYARIREAREKLQYYAHLVHLMEREFFATRAHRRVCYERAKDQIENPERYRDEEHWSWRQPPPGDEHDAVDDDFEDDLGFESIDDEDWGEAGGDWRFDDHPAWPPPPPVDRTDDARLKRLYRELSRRLHPDANDDLSREQQELWYQVQEAYADRDADRLELLLTHANLADGSGAATSTVASLIDLTEQIRGALKTLRGAIRKARKEPSWGFLSWQDKEKRRLSAEAKCDLRMEAEYLEDRLRLFIEEVDDWKNDPMPPSSSEDTLTPEELWLEELLRTYPNRGRRARPSPRRGPPPNQMDFGFF